MKTNVAYAALAAVLATALPTAPAALAQSAGLKLPSNQRVFVQAGAAKDARLPSLGLSWDWAAPSDWGVPGLTGYWQADIGRWLPKSDQPNPLALTRRGSTQIGFTPVLRYYPAAQNQFFVEGGIGVHAITPVYRNGPRQFSTVLNFGSHIGGGLVFGAQAEHVLTLRLQHFSNASIKRPNPGTNAVALHYAHAY